MRRWVGPAVLVALVALVVLGGLKVVRPSLLPGGGAHVDGPLLVSAAPGISRSGMAAIVRGEIGFDDGCMTLDATPVVWPHGTEWDDDSDEVVLPNGQRASDGDAVTGGGGWVRVEWFTSGERHYGSYGEEGERLLVDCAGPTGEVAFFNEGSEVELVG